MLSDRFHSVAGQGRLAATGLGATKDDMGMTVKGTAFLARRNSLDGKLASLEVEALLEELAQTHPVFGRPILASTLIPVRAFIAFNDLLIDRHYGGVSKTYWRFGQESAAFALAGPYKNLVRDRDRDAYAQTVSTAWKVYYSHGRAEGSWHDDVFRYRIEDVPVHHVYFEYTACGWVEQGLELIGEKARRTICLAGYGRGDRRVQYDFYCG